ncbi:uncharacterized protein NDAI_0H00510 [Naumovozyma dairenensis CBS 421]|uniref:Protein transport protein SEC9 n=1 Tax=Naumovozyma dairenensis (strain ATCC 10597 / BCRC 20456 / CBS 421 / NBRC 0211 / NRRL Y-12639) TaxID=1071378 RepID=G0WEL4_NAUDC|nr:hypothetical protein NDAI_0H00510 [Naumovozyma dairenensis CBS 421]CCD26225.1 hypothetical protein NDAI_0H00510 [Naumovozyma dairenensis CBS 421]
MGLKKFFKLKPPPEDTKEQNRENLSELGYTVKNPNKKKHDKFSAYGNFARDRNQQKIYAPPGYEPQFTSDNEYGLQQDQGAEPYAQDDLNKSTVDNNHHHARDPYSSSSPYASSSSPSTDPYLSSASTTADPYSARSEPEAFNYSDPICSIQIKKLNERQQQQRNAPSRTMRTSNTYTSSMGSYNYNNNNNNNNLNTHTNRNYPMTNSYNGYNQSRETSMDPYANVHSSSSSSLPDNESMDLNAVPSNRSNLNRTITNASMDLNNPPISSSYEHPQNKQQQQQHTRTRPSNAAVNRRQQQNNIISPSPYTSASPSPYASMPASTSNSNNNISNSKNPYSSMSNINNDPYNVTTRNTTITSASAPSITRQSSSNPYNRRSINNNNNNTYSIPTNNNNTLNVSELDNESIAHDNDDESTMRAEFEFEQTFVPLSQQQQQSENDIDLNATIQEEQQDDGYNQNQYDSYDWQQQQQQQYRGYKTFEELQNEEALREQQQEDEEVDEIKQQIKFTKQSSVASTKNTLKMAQDAELAGMNTIGMLGHQSEKLNNVERNLDLLKVQNVVADDKVSELQKLNRSILAVHVSNPFNSKRRAREREAKLRSRKEQEKLMFEETNNRLYNSTQRIEGALNGPDRDDLMQNTSMIREKYKKQNILEQAKRYQFENDEEDDEMEFEIERNLDQIQQISGRLKKLAVATGEELNSQQERLGRIEEDTDRMDIKIHMNTTKLAGIR